MVEAVGLVLGLLSCRDVWVNHFGRHQCLEHLVFQFLEDVVEAVRVLRCDGVDEVLVPFEQFEHSVFLVQGVELFLGHLLELLDELD